MYEMLQMLCIIFGAVFTAVFIIFVMSCFGVLEIDDKILMKGFIISTILLLITGIPYLIIKNGRDERKCVENGGRYEVVDQTFMLLPSGNNVSIPTTIDTYGCIK